MAIRRLVNGGGGIIQNSTDISADIKSGGRSTVVFTGSRAECEAQKILERSQGATFLQVKSKGDGDWELTATYSWDISQGGGGDGGAADGPTNTHELENSVAQQDVWTNQKLLAAIPSADDRENLALCINQYRKGAFSSRTQALASLAEVFPGATAAAYFKLIAFEEVDHWIFYRSVYSRTITAATPQQVKASFVGTQKIWTTAQLRAYEKLPNDWWFTLPPSYKWHKSEPKVKTDVGKSNKTEISYHYIASSQITTLLYDNYA